MYREIPFEEKNNKGKELLMKICRYVLWGVMIAAAAFLASRALRAEGKEAGLRKEEDFEAAGEYGDAVEEALLCQMKLMEYAGITKKEQRLYCMQMHRTAFLKNIKGQDTGLYWCNELSNLTMEAYGRLDDDGKKLLTDCQLGRERWKAAGDKRSPGDEREVRELINQLYYTQLKYIMNQNMSEGAA